MSSGFVEKKKKKISETRRWLGGGGVKSKWRRGGDILCRRRMRSRVHVGAEAALHRSGVLTVTSDPERAYELYDLPSLVNEQPAHPAELAGKPPPEGTKVFEMELLKFGGLADIT